MLKIRRSRDRLIFNMGIPILIRWHLYIETPPHKVTHLSVNGNVIFHACMAYYKYHDIPCVIYLPQVLLHPLWWRHNRHDGISNHQPHNCLLNRLLRRRSKKTSKLHVTGLCAGNSPGTDEFPKQMASNMENVSISWRHHECDYSECRKLPWQDNIFALPHFMNIWYLWYPKIFL